MTKNILVYLKSRNSAFSMTEYLAKSLQQQFPQANVDHCNNTQEFIAKLPSAEIVLCWKFDLEWYPLAPKLKHILTPAAGKDWIAFSPQVTIHHGHFHGPMMTESFLANLFWFKRKMDQMRAQQSNKVWNLETQSPTRLLRNDKLLILGYGNIGREIARCLKPFVPQVFGLQRNLEGIDHLGTHLVKWDSLDELLPEIDHLVFLLPADHSTQNVFTADHFKQLKKGACFFNLGRGGCYSEQDLLKAIQDKTLAYAWLDVFASEPLSEQSPLWSEENIYITPHSACIYQDYQELFLEEVKDVLSKYC